jgi:hypothetical protein
MFNNVIPDIVSFIRYVEKHGRARQTTDGNIIRRTRFACCLPSATAARTEYGISIAFVRQQWLRECTNSLRNTYICLSAYTVRGEMRFYKKNLC